MTDSITELHPDAAIIEGLGGPTQLARMLGFTQPGSAQRVHNWKHRGIPEIIRLRRPDVFAGLTAIPTEAAKPKRAA